MSFTEENLEEFADEMFALLQATNQQVTDKSLAFHREHCVNEDKDDKHCEVNFMRAIELLIEVRVQRAMHAAMHPDVEPDIMVIQVQDTVDPKLN